MQIPAWAIAGLLGALGGGFGTLLGVLAERAGFPKWGRYLGIFGAVLGLSLARDGGLVTYIQSLAWSDSTTESVFLDTNPQLYGYLKTAFPEDYAQLIRQGTAIVKAGGSEIQVQQKIAQLTQAIRVRYAPNLRSASEEDLRVFVSDQIAFYQTILKADGPAVCTKVAVDGPIAMIGTDFVAQHHQDVELQGLDILKAVRGAIDHPTHRDAATNEDWAEVAKAITNSGAPRSYIDAIASPSEANPDTCQV